MLKSIVYVIEQVNFRSCMASFAGVFGLTSHRRQIFVNHVSSSLYISNDIGLQNSMFKELRNSKRQKKNQVKTQSVFWDVIFHPKYTLCNNKLSTSRKIYLILLNCAYLVFFSLEIQRRLIQTEIYITCLLCLKRNDP